MSLKTYAIAGYPVGRPLPPGITQAIIDAVYTKGNGHSIDLDLQAAEETVLKNCQSLR